MDEPKRLAMNASERSEWLEEFILRAEKLLEVAELLPLAGDSANHKRTESYPAQTYWMAFSSLAKEMALHQQFLARTHWSRTWVTGERSVLCGSQSDIGYIACFMPQEDAILSAAVEWVATSFFHIIKCCDYTIAVGRKPILQPRWEKDKVSRLTWMRLLCDATDLFSVEQIEDFRSAIENLKTVKPISVNAPGIQCKETTAVQHEVFRVEDKYRKRGNMTVEQAMLVFADDSRDEFNEEHIGWNSSQFAKILFCSSQMIRKTEGWGKLQDMAKRASQLKTMSSGEYQEEFKRIV